MRQAACWQLYLGLTKELEQTMTNHTWDLNLSLYCADNDQAAQMRRATNAAGIESVTSLHMPPNPVDGAIKHTITAQVEAVSESHLEQVVRDRFKNLFFCAREWECEAESDVGYCHFESTRDEQAQLARDFEIEREDDDMGTDSAPGTGAEVPDELDKAKPSSRLTDFLS